MHSRGSLLHPQSALSPSPPRPLLPSSPSPCASGHSERALVGVSPRPKITFAWGSDLERTRKAEPKEELLPAAEEGVELQKTRPVHRLLRAGPETLNSYKASLISIQSEGSGRSPKVEESLIVVDYFNPSGTQKLGLESILQLSQQHL